MHIHTVMLVMQGMEMAHSDDVAHSRGSGSGRGIMVPGVQAQ